MTTDQQSRGGGRLAGRLLRTSLVAVVVGLAVPAGAGVAAADTGSRSSSSWDSSGDSSSWGSSSWDSPTAGGRITPTLDCVVWKGWSDFTAVLGYTSTYRSTVTIPVGSDNNLALSPDGSQPTTFQPGTHHGVFSIHVTTLVAFWTLDGRTLVVTSAGADTCSNGVVMPAAGNGTGLAIGLGVAGAIGAVVVRRWRRRTAPSGEPDPRASDVPELQAGDGSAPQQAGAPPRGRHRAAAQRAPLPDGCGPQRVGQR